MKKFEHCLIASDYDGTFYADDGSIPQGVVDAIRYYISEGGHFTISTGRVRQGFHRYDSRYINAPVLLANGACAYDYEKGEYYFFSGIGAEGKRFVRALMERYSDLSVEIYAAEQISAIHMSGNTRQHFAVQGFSYSEIESPEQIPLPWCKMMLDAGERTLEIQKFIRSYCDDPAFLPTSGGMVEIMKKGVNKGAGLLLLADMLQVPANRVFAVGDGYNDVDMLRAAHIGFVPENGSREALEAADRIVRSNNDGAVAHVIEILDKEL